jgi:hypothetical protein
MHITHPHLTLSVPVNGVSNYLWRRANTYRREGIFLFVGGKVSKMSILKVLNNKGSITIQK